MPPSLPAWPSTGDWIHVMVDFLPLFLQGRQPLYLSVCFFMLQSHSGKGFTLKKFKNLLPVGVYSKGKEFAPTGTNSFPLELTP